MFGNIGMLYFNGAYDSAELKPYFEEACSFFGNEVDEYGTILLIGHWNGNATIKSWLTPYGGQLVVSDIIDKFLYCIIRYWLFHLKHVSRLY